MNILKLLEPFRVPLGPDHEKYSNHIHRVFDNCILIDHDHANHEKYAIAAVFHDIGIWTAHTIDYIDPSIIQAKIYLAESGKAHLTDEIIGMIYYHHKVRPYKGLFATTIETFRKADWIDVSLGLFTYGVPKKFVRQNRKAFPNRGFHFFLIKKITRNFFRHPLHPLPMFKK
jgi:hypothetical protein